MLSSKGRQSRKKRKVPSLLGNQLPRDPQEARNNDVQMDFDDISGTITFDIEEEEGPDHEIDATEQIDQNISADDDSTNTTFQAYLKKKVLVLLHLTTMTYWPPN